MKVKLYIIINQDGAAYTGMVQGSLNWSYDWNQAKPLAKENTTRVLNYYKQAELLEL
jgi:hypothetical protein